MPRMDGVEGGSDPAVQTAQDAFRSTARQQLKRLVAEGVDKGAASSRLLDELVQPRPGSGASSSRTPNAQSVQEIIARTGFSREHAAQTLLLHEEIARLRREGHNTATVIESLSSRLKNAGRTRPDFDDENGEHASQRKHAHSGPSPKRLKLDDGGAITTHTLTHEADWSFRSPVGTVHALGAEKGGEKGGEKADKRWREEAAPSPLAQLKKMKLWPPSFDSSSNAEAQR